jgi:hypothetical protein
MSGIGLLGLFVLMLRRSDDTNLGFTQFTPTATSCEGLISQHVKAAF